LTGSVVWGVRAETSNDLSLPGHLVDIPTVGPTLATMIGLGVGIDYTPFLVTKHRHQLAHGMERHESIARSVATSRGAIVFAGAR
jgi:putative drug exporter of the RND superfamily